jgi:hypothetical protein
VTAAHCTENINKGPIKVYLGMHNRLKSEGNRIVKTIDKVVVVRKNEKNSVDFIFYLKIKFILMNS